MGIYDRDYYRNEGPSFLGSLTTMGRVCTWLIAINVVFFLAQLVTPATPRHVWIDGQPFLLPPVSGFTDALALDVDAVLRGQVWRLLTYAFLHDTESGHFFLHIFFNMLLLWWFGTEVEAMYGSREFLAVYLIAATLGGVVFTLGSVAGVQPGKLCVGASGAVTAVLVLFALHFPNRVVYFMGLVPVPIWLLVLFNHGMDLVGFLNTARGHVGFAARTAYTVHLGGAMFALAYYKAQLRLTSLLPDLRGWRQQRSRPKLRVFREEEEPVAAAAPRAAVADVDEHLEAKLDAVLAKVAKHGRDSLTDGERQILLRASEVYKKKRS